MLSIVTSTTTAPVKFFYKNWKTVVFTSLLTLLAKKVFDEIQSGSARKITKATILKAIIGGAIKIPGAAILVQREMQREVQKMETSIFAHRKCISEAFPEKGESPEKIMEWLRSVSQNSKYKAQEGKLSGTLYYDEKELLELQAKAESLAGRSNMLHPDVNPWVLQCEAECIHWAREIFGGNFNGSEVCGVMTSGGSGSIFHACWAYRNRALDRGISEPEIVLPESAHSAFKKAAHILGMKVIEIPTSQMNSQVRLDLLEKAISSKTAMIVGSAVAYSHGFIDNIEGISEIAIRKGIEVQKEPIPLHVDACLGGFILPFADPAGLAAPNFDFRVAGVTSISADNHKFGNAEKGASTLLYRNKKLRRYQYFKDTKAHIGIYGSPGQEGSQSGKPFVSAWVAMVYFGKEGYKRLAGEIIRTRAEMERVINEIKPLQIIGKPQYMVVAFHSANILNIATAMSQKGWDLNVVRGVEDKPAVHFCVTSKHALDPSFIARFKADLQESVKNPAEKLAGGAAAYGSSMVFPTENMEEAMNLYFDTLLQIKPNNR